jgi:hypothetical protein
MPVIVAGTLAGCDAADAPEMDTPSTSAGGKADDGDATQAWADVVFVDGYLLDAEAHWSPSADAVAQRVTWSLSVEEGGRQLSLETKASDVVEAGRASTGRNLSADYFFDLGEPSDDMTDLRSLVLQVDIEACADAECSTTLGEAVQIRRPVSFLARPYPQARLRSWGRDNDLGSLDTEALGDLSEAIERTECRNVLLSVNGTMFEGSAGADAAWHFMRGRGYDCLVSVAYHDRDGGWGGLTSDDTLMLCESAELGLDALEPVWEAAIETPGIEQWDIFGHSKGGAASVKFYQRRWSDLRAWPQSRVYTIGLPWRMGAQYLPTPDDYEPGRIYAHEQIVAFTWTNDAVKDVDRCVDLDAVRLSETHDYTPMFSKDIDDDAERVAIRDAFIEGIETWVGARY